MSASGRHRAFRERRKRGAFVIQKELCPDHVAALVRDGYLDLGRSQDRAAISRAFAAWIDDRMGVTRVTPPPAASRRGKGASHATVGATELGVTPEPLQQPHVPGENRKPPDDGPRWQGDAPIRRVPANSWWPSDSEITVAFGQRAALFVQAVRDWQQRGWWRNPAGLTIGERPPTPGEWLSTVEATRMRSIGDPIEALRRRRAGL